MDILLITAAAALLLLGYSIGFHDRRHRAEVRTVELNNAMVRAESMEALKDYYVGKLLESEQRNLELDLQRSLLAKANRHLVMHIVTNRVPLEPVGKRIGEVA
jgi:hypothetical protein